MAEFGEIFAASPYWIWFGIGLAFFGLEIATMSLFLIWVGLAALLTAAVTFAAPGTPMPAQMALFAALGLALTVAGRSYFAARRAPESDRPDLNRRGTQMVGRRVSAIADFERGEGAVAIDDGQWSARLAPDQSGAVAAGDELLIAAVEGATLVVKHP